MNDLQIEQLIEKREIRNKNPYEETNINEFISDLKSLHPTEDTTQERGFCPLKKGEYMKDNFWNLITYDELQKWVKPIYNSKSPDSNRKHIIEDIC